MYCRVDELFTSGSCWVDELFTSGYCRVDELFTSGYCRVDELFTSGSCRVDELFTSGSCRVAPTEASAVSASMRVAGGTPAQSRSDSCELQSLKQAFALFCEHKQVR